MGWRWILLGAAMGVTTPLRADPTLFMTFGPQLSAGANLQQGPFVAPGLEFTVVHFDRVNLTASPWQSGFVSVDATTDGRGRVIGGIRAGISFCGLELGGAVQWSPAQTHGDAGVVLGPMCSVGLAKVGLRLLLPWGIGPEPSLHGAELGLVVGIRIPEGLNGRLNWAWPK